MSARYGNKLLKPRDPCGPKTQTSYVYTVHPTLSKPIHIGAVRDRALFATGLRRVATAWRVKGTNAAPPTMVATNQRKLSAVFAAETMLDASGRSPIRAATGGTG